ncbi:amino acid permease [Trypanosoma rangeli]|uniref:Amino acid permease n=1 Tax=Trypanosoma rangeli TaxID=5698 RepID=A0A3R7MTP9_TRYRA|nr:amino acid permease [Trypanosoma rangeli]RNF11057.1 amino acid permease [Trypanosoma rangeli]|eukprot:RNF11057.1 amino acid permease [Trypanosoma rangeli]
MRPILPPCAVDDPRHDGVELLEVAKNQTGYFRLGAADRVKVRIDGLNQEAVQRVSRRREPDNSFKRLLQRIIPHGGVVSSGCDLASSSSGAGILALPYAFNKYGLVMALVYLVVIGILAVYSFILLGIVGKRTGLRDCERVAKVRVGDRRKLFFFSFQHVAYQLWC